MSTHSDQEILEEEGDTSLGQLDVLGLESYEENYSTPSSFEEYEKEESVGDDGADEIPAGSMHEPVPMRRKHRFTCYLDQLLPRVEETPSNRESRENGVEFPKESTEKLLRSKRQSHHVKIREGKVARTSAQPYGIDNFILTVKAKRKSEAKKEIKIKSTTDDLLVDRDQVKQIDLPDEEGFKSLELRILCRKLREQRRFLEALKLYAEGEADYPPPSEEVEGIEYGEDLPCEFPAEDVGSQFVFNDKIMNNTDLLVMLIKSGSSYQTEDHRFRFRRTDTIMDLKVTFSGTIKKQYHRLDVKSKDSKNVCDSSRFTCLLPSDSEFEPSFLQLFVLPDLTSEETEEVKYFVYLVPDVEMTHFFRGTFSGESKYMLLPKLIKPPYLGGFKDWVNCKDFHNASTQTCEIDCSLYKKFEDDRWKEKWTQIFQMQHACVQTPADTSTQMTFTNVYRSNVLDKVLVPSGTYVTGDEYRANIINFVITVQKYLRRWHARRLVEKRLAIKLCILKAESEQLDFTFTEHEKESLMQRRLNPKTKDDFDLLYVDLEAWRLEETRKIVSKMKGAQRKAALSQLLDDECRLIKCIGDLTKMIEDDRLNAILQRFMERVSNPKIKRDSKGIPISIDHWYKVESRHLNAIYRTMDFNTKFMTQTYERMSVLGNVKKYLQQEHKPTITDLKLELNDLIERETILMLKKVKMRKMMGLRKRVNHLFHLLLKKPEFNPAVTYYNETLHRDEYLKTITHCVSCNKGMPVGRFPNSIQRSLTPRTCMECQRTNNRGCKRADSSAYHSMLLKLRLDEREYDDGARIAFFVQIKDIRYLVDCIWHMKSIISKNSDLMSMALVRWRVDREWSPWNCLLVTMHEALLHTRSIDIRKTYSDELLFNINLKHTQARHDFAKLLRLRAKLPTYKKLLLPALMSCPEWARRDTGFRKARERKAILCEQFNLFK